MKYKVEKVSDVVSTLAEGPHWDEDKNTLYWVDILGKKINIHDFNEKTHSQIELEEYIGVAIPDYHNNLILGMETGIFKCDLSSSKLEKIINVESDKPDNRFNDGKCDSYGRLWIGTMSMEKEREQGSLYCYEEEASLKKKLSRVSISNGIAWSPDQKIMYHIDTPTRRIAAYNYCIKTGDINFDRIAFEIPEGMGNPDGMTIDIDGNLWVAHWGGAIITYWDPEKAVMLDKINIPAKNVTSCTFGGDNLETLFVTTAKSGLSDLELIEYPESGAVFKIKTKTKGFKANKYGRKNIN